MVDIHAHVLPCADDGPQSEAQALHMARAAAANGIRTIVATPHHGDGEYINRKPAIVRGAERLNALLRKHGVPVGIVPGQELHCGERAVEELYNGAAATLNGSRYVLLELPAAKVPDHAAELLHEMKVLGLVPIVAHPERNLQIAADPDALLRLVEDGALAQVTAQSLAGKFGARLRNLATALCRRNLIHFIASDAHNTTTRPFLMREAFEWVRKELGEETARYYADNAEKALADEAILPKTPAKTRKLYMLHWKRRTS